MALAIYEGTKKDQLVDKIVDEEILRLLGLENVNDLDYDDYKTLLRERVAAGRMPGNDIPTEDTQRLTEEFKRVKKETGKLKVKNNKIKFDSITNKKTKKSRPVSNPTKTLMGSSVEPEEEVPVQSDGGSQDVVEKVAPRLSKIENSLENILGNLTNQQKLQNKDSQRARVSGEKGKKKEREEKSENAIFKKLGAGAKKIASPLGDIFASIKKFFMAILGGIVALGLIDLFTDPKKFFRNLVNGVVDFFNGVIESIFNVVIKPINDFINTINVSVFDKLANDVNKALDAIDFLDVIPQVPSLNVPLIPLLQIPRIEPPEAEPEPMKVPGMTGGGEVTNITNKYYELMEGGGKVATDTGNKISSMGSDTQLVALTPGEVVMSKKAVDAYGADTLLGMNADAGGTNTPRMGMVPGYQNGGMVGASDIVSSMGFSNSDFDVFKNVVASIESGGKYDIAGGSGGHYDGKYQLGADAKTDGAKYAGVNDPGHSSSERKRFREDPQLQETLFAGFTKANHTYLMGISEYKEANSQRKLQILGYAHNQGMGGAAKWMKTGEVGSDGFGTKGTKYTNSIAAAFRSGSSPQVSSSRSTSTSGQSTGETAPYEFSLDDVKPMQSPTSQRPMIGTPGGGGGSSVVVAGGGGAQQQAPSSAGGGAQSSSPMFSPIDQNNPDLLVIKSIYSIV